MIAYLLKKLRQLTKRNCQPVFKILVRPGGQISENE